MHKFEIGCIVKDNFGLITHVKVKGIGIQPISTISKLITSGSFSFYVYKNATKIRIYAKILTSGGLNYLTTRPESDNLNDLEFLPDCQE
jgi:hypothetical protein